MADASSPSPAPMPASTTTPSEPAVAATATPTRSFDDIRVSSSGGRTRFDLSELVWVNQWVHFGIEKHSGKTIVFDGEGLLRFICSDASLDWSHGAQTLHAVFLLENFVWRLIEYCKVDVTVAFFADRTHRNWASSKHRLVGEVLSSHLASSVKSKLGVDVVNFSSCEDPKWVSYVNNQHPVLLLVSDDCISEEDEESATSPFASDNNTFTSYLVMATLALRSALRVATTNLELADNSLSGFEVTTRNEADCAVVIEHLAALTLTSEAETVDATPAPVSSVSLEDGGLGLISKTTSAMASSSGVATDATLAKVALLHRAVSMTTSITARSFSDGVLSLPPAISPLVSAFVDRAVAALADELTASSSVTSSVTDVADTSVADLWDGRLFYAMVDAICRHSTAGVVKDAAAFGLASDVAARVEAAFAAHTDGASSFWPLDITTLGALDAASKEPLAERDPEPIEPMVMSKMNSPFFREFAPALNVEGGVSDGSGDVADKEGDGADDSDDDWDVGSDDDDDAAAAAAVTDVADNDDDDDDDDEDDDDDDDDFDDWETADLELDGDKKKKEKKKATVIKDKSRKKFDETRVIAKETKPLTKWEKKNIQKYCAFLEKFSASLGGAGALGGVNNTHVVYARDDSITLPYPPSKVNTTLDKHLDGEQFADVKARNKLAAANKKAPTTAKGKGAKKQTKGGGSGAKGKGASAKEAIQSDNKKRKDEVERKRVEMKLKNLKGMCKSVDELIRQLAVFAHNLRSGASSTPECYVLANLALIESLLEQWAQSRSFDTAANLVRICFDTMEISAPVITPAQAIDVQKCLTHLGFPDAAKYILDGYLAKHEEMARKNPAPARGGKKGGKGAKGKGGKDSDGLGVTREAATFVPSYSANARAAPVPMSFQRFQLLHCGHLLRRSFDSLQDSRVSGFHPDKWQRDLLDVVDRRESALVVAPTSSGKTLVSYYAMSAVISDNRERKASKKAVNGHKRPAVVVYVSPTKALVNQVSAEVYRRFGNVIGVFTTDYSEKVDECEVLVTVPACLEILMLNTQWSQRMEYCIVDEVHCIQRGASTDVTSGIVWERVLQLVPCPILALSATVGGPERFHNYLTMAQKRYNRTVRLVHHEHRWCELQPMVYSPSTNDAPKFTTMDHLPKKDATGLKAIHPLTCVASKKFADGGTLRSVPLAPDETLRLYDAMSSALSKNKNASADMKKRLLELSPEKVWSNGECVLRDDVYTYEAALKSELLRWAANACGSEMVDTLLEELHTPGVGSLPFDEDITDRNFLALIVELKAQASLPAIFFCFDRNKATKMVVAVQRKLKEEEERTRASPEYQARLLVLSKRLEKMRLEEKRTRDRKNKNKKDEDEEMEDEGSSAVGDLERQINQSVDSRFSVAGDGRSFASAQDYWIRRIRANSHPLMADLVAALERGIGVHHAGLPRQYRQAVEALFRSGQLQVCVSTSTLALGINMPCRAVVFVNDSPFLTSLMYRQMAGRAGRRGFDDKGLVVFFGMREHRVRTLVTSQLAPISPSEPTTITIPLRMFVAYDALTDRQIIDKKQDALAGPLAPPMTSMVTTDMRTRFLREKHSATLFSIYVEILRRHNLVTETGKPIGLAGVTAHLHAYEPSNLLFTHLLAEGVVKKVCSTFDDNREETAQNLLLLLCHVFNVTPMPSRLLRNKKWLASIENSPSVVVLPDLTPDARKVVEDYRATTFETFARALEKLSPAYKLDEVETSSLPVSGLSYVQEQKEAAEGTVLAGVISRTRTNIGVRSPFVALSGHGPVFTPDEDLAVSSKTGIPVESHQAPVVRANGSSSVINGAAHDFYRHGLKSCLVESNGFTEGEAWQLMKDWNALLATIVVAMDRYRKSPEGCISASSSQIMEEDTKAVLADNLLGHHANDIVLRSFEYLYQKFSEKFHDFNVVKANEIQR